MILRGTHHRPSTKWVLELFKWVNGKHPISYIYRKLRIILINYIYDDFNLVCIRLKIVKFCVKEAAKKELWLIWKVENDVSSWCGSYQVCIKVCNFFLFIILVLSKLWWIMQRLWLIIEFLEKKSYMYFSCNHSKY